ncbi:hypothetical protein [Litoreibacter roseus]|uniref:hypothetical protein n=1 Tax=Litoreibacter roseus TaxID=2601869 RepID=UPI001359325F|nr:hypothetical protein [Litoreibacter roseus]
MFDATRHGDSFTAILPEGQNGPFDRRIIGQSYGIIPSGGHPLGACRAVTFLNWSEPYGLGHHRPETRTR